MHGSGSTRGASRIRRCSGQTPAGLGCSDPLVTSVVASVIRTGRGLPPASRSADGGKARARWGSGRRKRPGTGVPLDAKLNACFFLSEPWHSGSLQCPPAQLTESSLGTATRGAAGLASGPASTSQQVTDLGPVQLFTFEEGTGLSATQAAL